MFGSVLGRDRLREAVDLLKVFLADDADETSGEILAGDVFGDQLVGFSPAPDESPVEDLAELYRRTPPLRPCGPP